MTELIGQDGDKNRKFSGMSKLAVPIAELRSGMTRHQIPENKRCSTIIHASQSEHGKQDEEKDTDKNEACSSDERMSKIDSPIARTFLALLAVLLPVPPKARIEYRDVL